MQVSGQLARPRFPPVCIGKMIFWVLVVVAFSLCIVSPHLGGDVEAVLAPFVGGTCHRRLENVSFSSHLTG